MRRAVHRETTPGERKGENGQWSARRVHKHTVREAEKTAGRYKEQIYVLNKKQQNGYKINTAQIQSYEGMNNNS